MRNSQSCFSDLLNINSKIATIHSFSNSASPELPAEIYFITVMQHLVTIMQYDNTIIIIMCTMTAVVVNVCNIHYDNL